MRVIFKTAERDEPLYLDETLIACYPQEAEITLESFSIVKVRRLHEVCDLPGIVC